MSIQEGYNNNKRSVSFDTQDMSDIKIDKLTSMISKLSTQGSNQNIPFKPRFIKDKRRGQGINNYYDRGRQWVRLRSSSSDRYRRSNYRNRPQYGQNYRERSYFQNYREGNFKRGTYRGVENYRGQIFRREYRGNYMNSHFDRGINR